jgi:uncharacterized protein YcbX
VTATVAALACYPVKGCAAIDLTEAEFVETGIEHDRSFMLVGPDGVFLSQRVLPALAVIRPALAGGRLVLSAPDHDPIDIEARPDGKRLDVSLFGKWFGSGVDQGDAVAAWASAVLERPCRLVRVPPEHDRDGWGEHPGKTGFADAHAVLITADSSLAELNRRIAERGAAPVPMNRFRPNIVVTGWARPHTEDRVRLLRVGDLELGYSARAVRCAVPMVEQATGRRSGPEPIRSLATYRRERGHEDAEGGGVSFGMKAAVLKSGRIRVGDEIEVTRWDPR